MVCHPLARQVLLPRRDFGALDRDATRRSKSQFHSAGTDADNEDFHVIADFHYLTQFSRQDQHTSLQFPSRGLKIPNDSPEECKPDAAVENSPSRAGRRIRHISVRCHFSLNSGEFSHTAFGPEIAWVVQWVLQWVLQHEIWDA